MKKPIRLLLFASALAFLTNSSFGAAVQFADPNFESSFRSQVEKGWIWVSGYTGNNYQFKTDDLINISSLFLDPDDADGDFTSLADLQYFPNLQGLYIENASKITDFSPIWQLKDTLEYLEIEGARSPDFSGMSQLSKLRSLDLESCQLTNLNFLGSFPQLTELYLAGNYLDLSNSAIEQTLLNFSNLIQSNRVNQGWGWSSGPVEAEPQLPKSFQNLTSEMTRVQNANDPQSNLLKGIHALLHIVESTEATAVKEFAVAVGVDPSIRQFTLSDLPMLENYSHTLNRDFNSGKLAEMFQDSIIPSLEQADSYFSNVPSGSLITLTQDLTGTEEPVTVDYADILVLRSIVNLMATLASMQSAYDWDLNAGFIDDLEDALFLARITGNPDPNVEITAETLRTHNSDFGGIRDAGQLAKAKQFLESAIATYKLASPKLTEYSRLEKLDGSLPPDRLFVLAISDLDDEQEFRDVLDEFLKALNAPYELKDDDWNDPDLVFNTEDGDIIAESEIIDLRQLFAGKVDLAKLLPESVGNKFTTDVVSDPTLGGLFPQLTQFRVSGELLEAELVAGKYEVTVAVVGLGNVSGTGVHSEGELVTLAATPDAGYAFTGWGGDAAGSNNPLTLSVNSAKNLVANFVKAYLVLVQETEGGETSGSGTYAQGSVVTITAIPSEGYLFTGWSGDANGTTNPLTLGVDSVKNLTANFAKSLSVLAQASDGGVISGSGTYVQGSVVTLTAVPKGGYVFTGWSGGATGTDNPLSLALTGDVTISAIFEQVVSIAWDKTFGGSSSDSLYSAIPTVDGGYLLAGDSSSGVGGDKSEESKGSADYWVVKIDSNGNKLWDKTYGGSSSEELWSAISTADGGYLLAGNWVVKIDSNGNKLWDKTYGGVVHSVISTADGGYLLAGNVTDGLYTDFWVVRIDANGNKLWDKTYGGAFNDSLYSAISTADGGYLLAGNITDGWYEDFWVVRIDANGNKLWDKTYGGAFNDSLYSAISTADGGYLLAGESPRGSWVVRINADGNKLWDKNYGPSDAGRVGGSFSSVISTADGGYLLAGGSAGYWVVKIDSNGNKLWDKTYGGAYNDSLYSAISTADGGYLLAGESYSGVGGDKSEESKGSADYWVVKIDENGLSSDISDDSRVFVFWRLERLGTGTPPNNYDAKQSIILKQLSDDSEEVLFSITRDDLISNVYSGTFLSEPMRSSFYIEGSKVQASPDGSRLIFGYSLDFSGAAEHHQYLVRIISYNLATRKVSVIREWKATDVGSMSPKYVEFFVNSLVVDWDAGRIYFAEERKGTTAPVTSGFTKLVSCKLDGTDLKAVKQFEEKTTSGAASSYSPEIEQIHLGSPDETIRVMVTYGDRMYMGSYSEGILSLKADGAQASLPIENEGIGNDSATSSVSESFEPFSLSSDGSKILFAKYEGGNSAVGEPGKVSLLSLTKEGYDKQAYWSFDGNRSGAWNPAAGRTNPRITAMSDEKNGKIILVMEDQSTMAGSLNNLKAPELVELDVATGAAVTLVRGRQTLDAQGWGYLMRDDLDTGFLFSSSGTIEPPNESTKDTDGDGLPDEVEIAAGMDPDNNDSRIVNAVYNYFFERDGSVAKDLVAATPHTYQWYYQPEWGWIWTNEKIFPYVYRSSADGQTAGWLYFSQKSANPIRFYDYAAKKWTTLGE